ncbi:spidroin-2-like isoform X2 [Formica exsecta]|uniref:spidroin-2-like isoform X1 n=1 Tax=Formica exsecta TaxID=72781 RepID=UPI0011443954|nr:spidroin-2-like isoform X1 [Formica exsecta]XP_029661709.1 spidroin-2-like isoform X2 [Formica exsecta]
MDTKIYALLVLVGVLGSFMEAQATFVGYPYAYGNGRLGGPTSVNFIGMPRSKREIGDSNGETTTNQATTTTLSSTNPTTTPSSTTSLSSTTPSSTTPSTSPTTTPSTSPTTTPTTTEATSPTTTPTSTSATTPSTTNPTTPSTTTSESTKSTSKPKKSTDNDVLSRSNFDESKPEDSAKKPGSSSKSDKTPTPGPYNGPGVPGAGFGGFGPGFDPYNGYPGFNSIPGPGPNYAWTGTNNGPGHASAGASAGSFAGGFPGYPGAGYPGAGYPGAGFPRAGYPMGGQPMTTESSPVNNRGGFQDMSPNQNTPNYGGIDPLYNAGPGFFFPGQYPTFNDPTFDMIRRIQAQIEAQHQANMEAHNRLANEAANYGGGSYGGGAPQVSSASIGLGPGGGYQTGFINPVGPGIESRFADDLPAPSGNSFGVFASSSSSSGTGPDGKPINHKSSITGVNDNGKISYRTVHD